MGTSIPLAAVDLLRLAAGPDGRSDAQLLADFVRQRDPAAVAAIVRRHGPMVWGVCRRALAHHDAEDAFQATFLVLARRADSVRPPGLLGNWLYGVARRTSLKARAMAARRRAREATVDDLPDSAAPEPAGWSDLRPILDLELERLPARYRAPLVLCDLEGKTRQEAARRLGWPEGTVHSRLSAGRKKLAARLARRGLALSGGLLTVTLVEQAIGRVPADLMTQTVQLLADPAVASQTTAVLAQKVTQAMTLSRLKLPTLVIVAAGLVAGGLFLGPAVGDPRPSTPAVTVTADDKPMELKGHTEASFDVAYSSDGRFLVTTGLDKTVRVWDPQTGKELRTLTTHTLPVLAVAFEPDGKHFITAASEQWQGPNFDRVAGEIKRWDVATGKEVRTYPAPNGLPTLCVAVSPEGGRLVVGGGANGFPATVTCLDLRTGAPIWTHERENDPNWPYSAVDFSPDGRQVVATCGKREVNVIDAKNGQLVFTTSALPDPGLAAKFSPDGLWIAAGGIGKPSGIRVFDSQTGKRLPTIDTDLRWVRKLDFRKDGKLLAAAALFGVRVFDTASGQTVLTLKDFKVNVYGVAFSPDGKQLAVTADDKLVRVYTLKPGDAPAPAPKESLKVEAPNARKVGAAFLDLAIAGKVKEAREHTMSNVSENKVGEFGRLGVKRADVTIALAGATDALIITEVIEIPKEGKGHLLVYLRQKDGKWLVRDIDFEPSDNAIKKQQHFLESHPDAKPVKDKK